MVRESATVDLSAAPRQRYREGTPSNCGASPDLLRSLIDEPTYGTALQTTTKRSITPPFSGFARNNGLPSQLKTNRLHLLILSLIIIYIEVEIGGETNDINSILAATGGHHKSSSCPAN